MTMDKHKKTYEIIMALSINDDCEVESVRRYVTIPDITMRRLGQDRQYPFYLFYDEDGMELILQYDAIVEIRRVIV